VKILTPLVLSLALASCNSATERVDWVDYGDDMMQNPQYMADMTAAGATGPQHEALASRAGSWIVAGKMWMGPGAESMPMTATATIEVVLGGRYTVEEFKSDFMGMPFEGRLMQGYDNIGQQYWSLWTDTMSTGYWISTGTETSPGHVEFSSTVHDILTPNGRPSRMTTTDNGDGSYTMKMYDTREGSDEFVSMELHYTRG
jgi:hypothetical protein